MSEMDLDHTNQNDEQQHDPLADVPESIVGGDAMMTDNTLNHEQDEYGDIERHGKRNVCKPQGMILDPQINLQLSVETTRKLLNRKPEGRPKPLLRLVCKGCGLSTHDPDPILGDDWLELLGSVQFIVPCGP